MDEAKQKNKAKKKKKEKEVATQSGLCRALEQCRIVIACPMIYI